MARKLQVDEWLFGAAIGLALFGIVMVYSASAPVAAEQNNSQYHYVLRQAIWMLIGFGAMFIAMNVDYGILRHRWVTFGLTGFSLLALLAVFMFPRINGAHRWIRLGGLSLQPSEFAKLAMTIFLARLLERKAGEERSLWTFATCLVATGVFVLLVGAEPDLGTAMMMALIALVLIYTAGARLSHLAVTCALGVLPAIGMLLFVPWRVQRLMAFMDPWSDPRGRGFQIVQSLIAVGSGGTDGLGFAQGRQKLFFLPFAHSDFIFAVISEELGLFGALALVCVFAIFLWRGVRIALRAPDRFGLLLGLGVVVGVVAQALLNMSVVLSLVPTKGIPLPFISYGGSSLVPALFGVGVLLNISQRARIGT